LQQNKENSDLAALQIGIDIARPKLYAKLDKRSEQQFKEGLTLEVQNVLDNGYEKSLAPLTGIGYRHIIRLLNKEVDQASALELNKRDNRRYAKRQMTWFKRDKRIHWIKTSKQAQNLVAKFLKKQ